jgi:hypothetical protein
VRALFLNAILKDDIKPKGILNEELEGEECLNFYFSWIEGILIPCLRTRLRDQIHRSSLPKMFLFLLVDFKFENWNLKNRKRPQGHEIMKLWGWISNLQNMV